MGENHDYGTLLHEHISENEELRRLPVSMAIDIINSINLALKRRKQPPLALGSRRGNVGFVVLHTWDPLRTCRGLVYATVAQRLLWPWLVLPCLG